MSVRVLSVTALLAVLAQSANVNVLNNCPFEVQATPSQGGTDQGDQLLKPGDTYNGPADVDAMCLKLAPKIGGQVLSGIAQLEWSQPKDANTLFYDLSDINMGDVTQFLQYGMNLTSSDPSCDPASTTCAPVVCAPQSGSISACKSAYNAPNDIRTLGASPNYDVNMVLCTGYSNSDSDNAPSDSPKPASSDNVPAAPQPTTLATIAASAAPAPTSAPLHVDEAGKVYDGPQAANTITSWVQAEEVVTKVVTAREAEPTLAKRVAHPHIRHAHHHNTHQ